MEQQIERCSLLNVSFFILSNNKPAACDKIHTGKRVNFANGKTQNQI